MQDFEEMELIVKVCFELFKPMTLCPKLEKICGQQQNKFHYYMASVSGRSIWQNRAFWLVPERVGNLQYGLLKCTAREEIKKNI